MEWIKRIDDPPIDQEQVIFYIADYKETEVGFYDADNKRFCVGLGIPGYAVDEKRVSHYIHFPPDPPE